MILDLIMLSNNNSIDAESETDYSNLNINLRAKCDSDSSHIADSQLIDSNAYSSETIHLSSRLAADYLDEANNNNSVADHPRSASLGHRCVIN